MMSVPTYTLYPWIRVSVVIAHQKQCYLAIAFNGAAEITGDWSHYLMVVVVTRLTHWHGAKQMKPRSVLTEHSASRPVSPIY